MSQRKSHVLLIEDDKAFRESLVAILEREGYGTSEAGSLSAARASLKENVPDVVLLDLELPDGGGLELRLDEALPNETPFVVVTGDVSAEGARRSLRQGATDYLTKPVDPAELRAVLQGALRHRTLAAEVVSLRRTLRQAGRFGPLVGRSQPMRRVFALSERVAPTGVPVLVTGASGTGKELVAETIHTLSGRASGPFIAINCGAIPETLIESKLFGHEKGAFTGAQKRSEGVFEQADGGTLFLDEIGEMPLPLQVRLLRVLETSRFQRVGGADEIEVDVRVVAATNRDPKGAVAKGELREDLYHRLNVFPIHLPPLRERESDVLLLAKHFLELQNEAEKAKKVFEPEALERIRSAPWTGNVRQLKNAVARAWILSNESIGPDAIVLDDPEGAGGSDVVPTPMPAVVSPTDTGALDAPESGTVTIEVGTPLADAERVLIEATLEHCEGNKRKTARVLGVSVKTLYNRLNSYAANEAEEEAAT